MNLHDKPLKERAEIIARRVKGNWVCWRRGYHLDGSTIGHWDDAQRCRDCRAYRGVKGPWGKHARPWRRS